MIFNRLTLLYRFFDVVAGKINQLAEVVHDLDAIANYFGYVGHLTQEFHWSQFALAIFHR